MQGYQFSIPYIVRIADINYGGHVGNSAVLNFVQDGRIAYLQNLGNYSEMNVGGGCGLILHEVHIKYLKEMFLGDHLAIGVRTKQIRSSSIIMEFLIQRDEIRTSSGVTTLACFDYATRKLKRFDRNFLMKLKEFEALGME